MFGRRTRRGRPLNETSRRAAAGAGRRIVPTTVALVAVVLAAIASPAARAQLETGDEAGVGASGDLPWDAFMVISAAVLRMRNMEGPDEFASVVFPPEATSELRERGFAYEEFRWSVSPSPSTTFRRFSPKGFSSPLSSTSLMRPGGARRHLSRHIMASPKRAFRSGGLLSRVPPSPSIPDRSFFQSRIWAWDRRIPATEGPPLDRGLFVAARPRRPSAWRAEFAQAVTTPPDRHRDPRRHTKSRLIQAPNEWARHENRIKKAPSRT
jgi:hypothetical protein